jgi:hypothetical protein
MKQEHIGQALIAGIALSLFGIKRASGSKSTGNGGDGSDDVFNIYVGKYQSEMNEDDRRRLGMRSMVDLAESLTDREPDNVIPLFKKPAVPQDITEMRNYVLECQPIIEEYASRGLHVVGQKESLPTIEIGGKEYDLFEASLIAKEIDKRERPDYATLRVRRKLMGTYGAMVEGILRRYDLGPDIMKNYK